MLISLNFYDFNSITITVSLEASFLFYKKFGKVEIKILVILHFFLTIVNIANNQH